LQNSVKEEIKGVNGKSIVRPGGERPMVIIL
jgi:hypothetical protein